MKLPTLLHTHPRVLVSAAVGLATALLVPDVPSTVTRSLVGWDVGVWLFLVLVGLMMVRADHGRLRRSAEEQSESALAVLTTVSFAALFSLVAIVMELSAAKGMPHARAASHIVLALVTVASSWVLLPTLYAMNYASAYYGPEPDAGLKFPDIDDHFSPDYVDFLYFSFTIAVASQTADVSITTRPMRRLVLSQAILSFVFNTTILALTINIAAGLF